MKKLIKRILVLAVAALFAFKFTACDSNTSTHSASEHATSEDHTGHTNAGEAVINTPVFTSVSGDVKNQIGETYQSYLTLKNALVASNPDEAKKAAQSLKANAEKIMAAPVEGEAKTFIGEQIAMINQHADQIASSRDVEGQRAQLDMLSSSLYSLIKATGANTEEAYYQFCPMANQEKGAYWISENKEIRNPYFGDKMLNCGSTKETLSVQ